MERNLESIRHESEVKIFFDQKEQLYQSERNQKIRYTCPCGKRFEIVEVREEVREETKNITKCSSREIIPISQENRAYKRTSSRARLRK
jgi:hypothetical protein